jgi:hypothetical protein
MGWRVRRPCDGQNKELVVKQAWRKDGAVRHHSATDIFGNANMRRRAASLSSAHRLADMAADDLERFSHSSDKGA